MMSSVEYVEKFFKSHRNSTLRYIIKDLNQRLTTPEKGRFLILFAKEIMVNPENLVKPSLDWKSDYQSPEQKPKEAEG